MESNIINICKEMILSSMKKNGIKVGCGTRIREILTFGNFGQHHVFKSSKNNNIYYVITIHDKEIVMNVFKLSEHYQRVVE